MTYTQALEYLYAQLPMYHRVGAAAYKADLHNTYKIAELLGKPHLKIKTIHVAGTNGKGSSSHMIAAILQQSGYKTGLYTSPHLIDFRERIRINGKMIPKNCVIEFIEKHKVAFEVIKPSFFEWTFGLALDYFAQQEVDVAVIEVGLGGRLDSTNIITPQVSLITNISLDHTNLLGNTIDKIAREKAGIIKARIPVVISQYQPESASIFSAVAREIKAPLEFADKNFKAGSAKPVKDKLLVEITDKRNGNSEQYELDLTGSYQVRNLLGVLNLLEFLKKAGFIIEQVNVKKALAQVTRFTGLNGRWQKLSDKPLIIADTGHNEDGIKQVADNIKQCSYNALHMVIGLVNDKESENILSLFPKKAKYYFVQASVPRALEAKELCSKASKHKLAGKAFSTVEEGLKAAKKAAARGDMVFIGGSSFVVGDALLLFND